MYTIWCSNKLTVLVFPAFPSSSTDCIISWSVCFIELNYFVICLHVRAIHCVICLRYWMPLVWEYLIMELVLISTNSISAARGQHSGHASILEQWGSDDVYNEKMWGLKLSQCRMSVHSKYFAISCWNVETPMVFRITFRASKIGLSSLDTNVPTGNHKYTNIICRTRVTPTKHHEFFYWYGIKVCILRLYIVEPNSSWIHSSPGVMLSGAHDFTNYNVA